jgi:hypothetical protein
MVWKSSNRPEEPVLGVNEREDIKAFYQNIAYKVNRHAINLEKMEVRRQLAVPTAHSTSALVHRRF